MPESTLSLSLTDFRDEVSNFVYGPDYDTITTAEQGRVDRYIKRGLRQFYRAYEWSFLKLPSTFVTVADQADYSGEAPEGPPDWFSGIIIGDMTFADAPDYNPVPVVGENRIRSLRQANASATGRPLYIATRIIERVVKTPDAGQRHEFLVFPTPDAVYTLAYRYTALPNYMTESYPYPHGGMFHSETILQSCLAVAESQADENLGVQQAKYEQALAESIAKDRKTNSTDYYGKMRNGRGAVAYDRVQQVTFNGVLYDGNP